MKLIVSLFFFASTALGASKPTFDLKDTAVLGAYKGDPKAYMDYAEIRYNQDNELIFDANQILGEEYVLSADPSAPNVIYNEDINGECDDPGCGYMTHLKLELTSVKRKGQYVPGLKMEATYQYDYPEDEDSPRGEVKESYTFAWDKELDYAIPYYTNATVDTKIAGQISACQQTLKDSAIDKRSICPKVAAYQFRIPIAGKGWNAFVKDQYAGGAKALSYQLIDSAIFKKIEADLASAAIVDGEDITATLTQIRAIADHIAQSGDEFLLEGGSRRIIYVINNKDQMIYTYTFGAY